MKRSLLWRFNGSGPEAKRSLCPVDGFKTLIQPGSGIATHGRSCRVAVQINNLFASSRNYVRAETRRGKLRCISKNKFDSSNDLHCFDTALNLPRYFGGSLRSNSSSTSAETYIGLVFGSGIVSVLSQKVFEVPSFVFYPTVFFFFSYI